MNYLGSKAASGAYQAIIAAMPPHDTYLETHLGSGAIARRKPPAARNIGIDLDASALAGFGHPAMELHQGDAVAYLQQFDYTKAGRVLIYADPPYLQVTRSSNNRYKHEYSDDDHRALIRVLRWAGAEQGAAVMISGYPSALYDSLLPDWRTVEFQVMTRGGVRTEKLWMNFAETGAHWASYAGCNFTERQRIKRKAHRWAENYHALPEAEKLAVLAAMLAPQRPT
jgi:DNA adenine methylase